MGFRARLSGACVDQTVTGSQEVNGDVLIIMAYTGIRGFIMRMLPVPGARIWLDFAAGLA